MSFLTKRTLGQLRNEQQGDVLFPAWAKWLVVAGFIAGIASAISTTIIMAKVQPELKKLEEEI